MAAAIGVGNRTRVVGRRPPEGGGGGARLSIAGHATSRARCLLGNPAAFLGAAGLR